MPIQGLSKNIPIPGRFFYETLMPQFLFRNVMMESGITQGFADLQPPTFHTGDDTFR